MGKNDVNEWIVMVEWDIQTKYGDKVGYVNWTKRIENWVSMMGG